MRLTYAIADLHGRFDLLSSAYEAIGRHAPDASKTIVHLGDYVDRGPQSREIISFLMSDHTVPSGARRICLKGNHEAMMVETLATGLNPSWWIGNGGGQTLLSYGHPPEGLYNPGVVPQGHIAWLDRLPLRHSDRHRIFVHAGVDPDVPLTRQPTETLLWKIYPDTDERGHSGRHVVHGHHQFADGPLVKPGRTDLDTLAWATGRLVIGVFDDDQPGGAVEFLEVIGEPDPRFSKMEMSQ